MAIHDRIRAAFATPDRVRPTFARHVRATGITPDRVRAAFVVALLVAGAAFANGVTGYEGTTMAAAEDQTDRPLADRHPVVYPADGVTVVAAEGFPDHDESAGLAAFAPGGEPLYVDTSLDAYLAVEPDRDGDLSVRYVGETTDDGEPVRVVERVDLLTGEVERLHTVVVKPDDPVDDPRTVQRLADGGTLVVNAERNEVIERSHDGEVVWSAEVVRPRDAVRLDVTPGTERALGGGPDADKSSGQSVQRPSGQYAWAGLEGDGLEWLLDALPYWVLVEDLPALALLGGSLGSWLLAESWWRVRGRVHGRNP